MYEVPGMRSVRVRSDIVYKRAGELALELDVYLPATVPATVSEGKGRPVVIFVHGDAAPEILRNAKDWGCFVSWGQLMAASGLAAITFNHRSSEGRTRLADAASDVSDLLAHVRSNATDLSVDPDRIGLWVCSMGPPAALHTLLPDPPEFIRCIVCFYGAMDLVPLRAETPPDVPDEVLADYSPARVVERSSGRLPPILVARAGREDRPWLNPGLDRFTAAAIARGAEVDLLNHPTGGHAFDVLDDDSRSKEIIGRTVEFLRSRLLGGEEDRDPAGGRAQDMLRHLEDLRTRTFEGTEARAERIRLFERAVELLDPVVRSVLRETNGAFLDGRGEVERRSVDVDGQGDAEARWELSWPEQRSATNVRAGGSVSPVQVVAWFAGAFTHPHLRGSRAGNWPMQILDGEDARRQEPIVRAIVEAELHERIFEGTWKIIPAAASIPGIRSARVRPAVRTRTSPPRE